MPTTEQLHQQPATAPTVGGATIMLGSGSYFYYEHPLHNPPTPQDIACGLGFMCRFNGQAVQASTGMRVFYSVAQHCVLMAQYIQPEHAYAALMHEVAEAVCCDVTGPLKTLVPEYRHREKLIEAELLHYYGAVPADPQHIKLWDRRMLATEKRDLMLPAQHHTWDFVAGAQPLQCPPIEPWGPQRSAVEWLAAYRRLAPPGAPPAPGNALSALAA